MSITRRVPSKPLPSKLGSAKSMALLIDVLRALWTGTSASLAANARAFEIHDGDSPQEPRRDGIEHRRVEERGDVPLPLELRLQDIDAARDVDGENELEIHRLLGSRSGRRCRDRENRGQR
jgi:hypothetical protein